MLTVGLTGNAGSGKSTVAEVWREQGVLVIDADALGREAVDEDRDLRRALAIEFGDEVLEPSANADTGALRRDELARRAFATPEAVRALNRIVHPPLLRLLERRLAEARATNPRLVAVDAALIFELGTEERFDRIVLVTASPEARRERLRRRGVHEAALEGLMASQIPDAEKESRADLVVRNDGSLAALRSAALDVLARLLQHGAPAGTAAASHGSAPGAVDSPAPRESSCP
ncbi:MAG: dephospho-CoA kinase [Gemmatimonadota bacterium]